MKKRAFATLLALVMVISLVPVLPASAAETTLTPVTDEDGTEWYELATAEDLTAFRNLVNGLGVTPQTGINARLTEDITYAENVLKEDGTLNTEGSFTNTWTATEYKSSSSSPSHYSYGIGNYNGAYTGTFDGQGHRISGLYQRDDHTSSNTYMGLFSYIGAAAVIKNVTVTDSYFYAGTNRPGDYTSDARFAYVGGICGYSKDGAIEGCTAQVCIVHSAGTAGVNLGGICGDICNGTIQSCVATGTITDAQVPSINGNTTAGGICGNSWSGAAIRNCASLMDITLETRNQAYAGGIIGYVYESGVVNSCYNGGDVHGGGAIVGAWRENTNNRGELTNVVKVSGNYYLDGAAAPDTQGMGNPVSCLDTGRLCWLLNGGYAQAAESVWRQNLNGVNKDAYPVPNAAHARVYRSASGYTNDSAQAEVLTEPALSEDGYYQLRTKNDLFWLALAVNSNEDNDRRFNARLMNDIAVNEDILEADGSLKFSDDFDYWVPMGHTVGSGYNIVYYPYSGVFDGNGHSISGLLVRGHDLENVGFMAWGGNGEIRDLTIQDSCFVGYQMVGGIVAYSQWTRQTNLTNCHVKDSLIRGFICVGGLGGVVSKGELSRCSNSASVTGCQYVGGVVGYIPPDSVTTTLTNCWNTGTVHGFTLKETDNSSYWVHANGVGGVCGYAGQGSRGTSLLISCWNAGAVTSDTTDNYGSVAGALNGAQMLSCAGISTAPGPAGSVVTPKGFASGQAVWILNGGDNQAETPVWYQNLDNGKTPDPLPVPDATHGRVYKGIVRYSNTPAGEYSPQRDEEENYLLSNVEDLYWFAREVNKGGANLALNARLTADIVVNENVVNHNEERGPANGVPDLIWTPVGAYGYSGTFDGQGHTVFGLYYNDESQWQVGLFGRLSEGGVIENLTVNDCFISGRSRVGAVVGWLNGGTVRNCHNVGSTVYGKTSSGDRGTGGITGYMDGGAILYCTNSGAVRATSGGDTAQGTGGIVGHVLEGDISYCINYGRIPSGGNTVGGIAGKLCAAGATVSHCGNTGYVTGSNHVGGLCGAVEGGAALENCWTTYHGYASYGGTTYEGAVAGSLTSSTISDCFYLSTIPNYSQLGTSKTQAEFNDGTVCEATGLHNAQGGVCAFCGKADSATLSGTAGEWTITGDLVSLNRSLTLIGAQFTGGVMGRVELRPVHLTAAQPTATGSLGFAAGRLFLLDPATLAPVCEALR